MALHIEAIPCRADNYAYLLDDGSQPEAWVVDPSEAEPVQRALERRTLRLAGILLTHHHHDHIDGVEALVSRSRVPKPWVAAHISDRGRIPGQTVEVEADTDGYRDSGLRVAGLPVEAMHVPGHTLGAVAWKIGEDVFTGDTLFAGGCGRLFEGTPGQLHASLRRLVDGPGDRRLWFGHEYTAANLKFAAIVEPTQVAISHRLEQLTTPSTPTTIARELDTNVFVRAPDPDAFAELRRRKDGFRA